MMYNIQKLINPGKFYIDPLLKNIDISQLTQT